MLHGHFTAVCGKNLARLFSKAKNPCPKNKVNYSWNGYETHFARSTLQNKALLLFYSIDKVNNKQHRSPLSPYPAVSGTEPGTLEAAPFPDPPRRSQTVVRDGLVGVIAAGPPRRAPLPLPPPELRSHTGRRGARSQARCAVGHIPARPLVVGAVDGKKEKKKKACHNYCVL